MPQFLVGFWCGCVAAVLVTCLLYSNRKRQLAEGSKTDKEPDEADGSLSRVLPKMGGPRVLIVDDSRLSRTVIKRFLAGCDCEVFEAANGTECLRLIKENSFDLVFLDQNMPGLSGDETLLFLRKDGVTDKDMPVIAVGSSVRRENEESFLEKGYAACLGKPIQEKRLNEIVSQVLSTGKKKKEPNGFFYEKGLKNFDGNEPMYRETLLLFAELWGERREQLRQFLEEENMEEYAILIHAVKGDSRTLGADAFGEMAYEQELNAKKGDIQAIRDGFERIIKEGDKVAVFFESMFS